VAASRPTEGTARGKIDRTVYRIAMVQSQCVRLDGGVRCGNPSASTLPIRHASRGAFVRTLRS
jgi:hypothetical protein